MIKQNEYSKGFQQGQFTNPRNQPIKGEDYFFKKVQYFYGQYAANHGGIKYGGANGRGRSISELRSYGLGEQDINKYKNILDPAQKRGKNKGKRLWNISWDTKKLYSKYRNIILNKFAEDKLTLKTFATDDMADYERELLAARMRFLANPITKKFMEDLPFNDEESAMIPDAEDVDYIVRMGGIRLAAELQMKDGLDITMDRSGYDELARMWHEDWVDLHMIAGEIQVDPATGYVMWDYVDPAEILVSPSIYPDFRDAEFVGRIKSRKVEDIVAEFPELKERNLHTLQQAYQGRQYGPYENRLRNTGRREEHAYHRLGHFGVAEITMYWIDNCFEKYIAGRHHRDGNEIYEKVDWDSELDARDEKRGKRFEEVVKQKVYTAKWIVGTDIMYDYGEADNIVKLGKSGYKKCILPIQVYMDMNPSITEKVIPHIDDLELADKKIQRILSKIPPAPRMIIDKSKLKNSIRLGDEDISMKDMLQRYLTDGVMIVASESEYDLPGVEGDRGRKHEAITFMPSGVFDDVQMYSQQMMNAIELIRQETGLNPVTDGTSVKEDMLKSVMQGMVQASNAALQPHMAGFKNWFKNMGRYTMHKWRCSILERGIFASVLQDRKVKITDEILKYDWNVRIEVHNVNDAKILLDKLMQASVNMEPHILAMMTDMIQQGDIRKAEYFLSKQIEKAKEIEHKRQVELAQAQAKANQEANMVAVQGEMQKLDKELANDMQMYEFRKQKDNEFAEEEYRRKTQLMQETKKAEAENQKEVVKENLKQTY